MISLGIDVGGTGCKCVAFREDGTQMALSYIEYPNPPGKVNLDAVVLREAVLDVITDCVRRLNAPDEVVAITVSSFGESFVPIGEDGQPLTDIILYYANSESNEFDAWVRKVGAERIMDVTRVLPDASYSMAKMLYTQRVAQKPVWKFLFIAGYLAFCLSGEPVCDVSLACRSLLYNVRKRDWEDDLLNAGGIRRDQLPEVLETGERIGSILPEVAARVGLKSNVQIVMGAHDQIVNALGAGISTPGQAVNVIGTSECIEPLFAQIPGIDFIQSNYACVPYLDQRGYVTYAYNISAGMVVKWVRDVLAPQMKSEAAVAGCSVYDLLNAQAPKEPTRLVVLPFLQGMGGTPEIDTRQTGFIAGLTTNTTVPELYRAVLEGTCFEMRYNLDKLAENGVDPSVLMACGGGARSRLWLQIKADVYGREIIPVNTEETGALGSAIVGFAAVTGEKDKCAVAKRFVSLGEPIWPNPEHRAYYEKQFEAYKQFRAFSRSFGKQ